MDRRKWLVLLVALGLMTVTAGVLLRFKTHQRLGQPGIKTTPIPGSPRLDIYLPELTLDYTSKSVPDADNVLGGLPKDTSLVQRRYVAPDGFGISINVVLMGTDRTSIHKPQFCLVGAGWTIDETQSKRSVVPMHRPHDYDLPVMKLLASKEGVFQEQRIKARGVYVYWFVADNQVTETHSDRMWRMAKNLISTGELQRWAYVSCFAVCRPGDEDATYERMKKFIASSVPQFQRAAGPNTTVQTPPERASR
ncbi:MAG: hypothetical protein JWQ71_4899 [Pedosphaera sp.]|nr:hypothetical protein [Pedosphaera sp.]